jgi:hypothetical protein
MPTRDQPTPASAEAAFEALYREAWADLARFRQEPPTAAWLLPEATPVLAFGAWQTARVATAALNPSEIEFMLPGTPARPLPPHMQRFLHWPADEQLTPARLAEARRRAEGYFTLGHAYTGWFSGYQGLLDALEAPFQRGLACHTDYNSPFATVVGWGHTDGACRAALARHGGPFWRRLLDLLPALELIVGQGAGWRTVPALFGFTSADWLPVPTPFDTKGGATTGLRPHLLYHPVTVAGRPVRLVWWRPNRGNPLTYLSRADSAHLGAIIAAL